VFKDKQMTKSQDYHDYVFKNGKLLGEFEAMYQNSTIAPWHQNEVAQEMDVKLAKLILESLSPFDSILDVGCGLGYFVNELSPFSSNIYGIDVSKTAIQKAEKLFPHIHFKSVDIKQNHSALFQNHRSFQLVACRALFWYVFQNLDQVAKNICSWVKPNGYLIIHQNFPPLESNFVGKSVLPTPDSLLEKFLSITSLQSVCTHHFLNHRKNGGNDNWHTFLLQKKV
jgi:2-polyprenyl-3-methyl-5-hydroxy-6-metoxy-1,4-benzoquinol methylase